MGKRDNPKWVYLTDEEAAQLEAWADETEKSQSELLRQAVTEYLDNDRTARIESRLDDLEAKIDAALTSEGQTEHTHTSAPTKSSSTVEKARSIAKRLYKNHEAPIKELDVERAIEDIAGADDRTLEKYKDMLKKRGLLYRHPANPVWTDEEQEWLGWCDGTTVGTEIPNCIEEYPIEYEEYSDKVEALATNE